MENTEKNCQGSDLGRHQYVIKELPIEPFNKTWLCLTCSTLDTLVSLRTAASKSVTAYDGPTAGTLKTGQPISSQQGV